MMHDFCLEEYDFPTAVSIKLKVATTCLKLRNCHCCHLICRRREDELECLLAQLIGARDALLFRIKEKLRLQLKDKDVHLFNINRKLFHTKN